MSNGDLSLVVVTWECADHLRRLVGSMNRHLDPAVDLIVVDNDSGDAPEGAARAWRGRTQFRQLDSNHGYGAAANTGIEMAKTECVVLLNPDTELLDAGIAELAEFARVNRCLCAPRLLNSDGSVQPSAGGWPVGVWPWIGAFMPGALQPGSWLCRTEPWRRDSLTRVAWLSGACIAAPRVLLEELGPFDPAIHLYAEDMDLGLRATQGGVPSFLCPHLGHVVHRRRGSTERRWPQGPEVIAATNRRAVVRRAYGSKAEKRAWLATRTNLRLRALAKRALRRDPGTELRELGAARMAADPPSLPAFPPQSA